MKKYLPVALRLAAASVFIVSGYSKLLGPYENFLAVIHSFELVRGVPADWAARIIPWMELILGVFLFFGLTSRTAAAGLLALATVFVGTLVSALLRRLPIEQCGCFGESLSIPVRQMVALDSGLWLGLLYLVFRPARAASLDGLIEKT